MRTRIVMSIAFAMLLAALGGCGDSITDSVKTALPGASWTLDPDPLGDRENPLLTYIRANWTGGDETATGGTHYDHIKVFGFNYTDLATFPDGADQAQFVVDHYDMYVWGGEVVGSTRAGSGYPDMLWIQQVSNGCASSGYDSVLVENWLNSADNENGYTWDDIVMHYKWDTDNYWLSIPGWNPADDSDGDGCADGPPSDTTRTAPCQSDSRVAWKSATSPLFYARDPRSSANHEAYGEIAYNTTQESGVDGVFFDVVAYEPTIGEYWVLGNTFEYEGQDESAPDFQYIADIHYYVPATMAVFEALSGSPEIHIANMVSPIYTCIRQASKEAGLAYVENVLAETWMVTNAAGYWTTNNRANYIDCPYTDWLEQGKGYIFTCRDQDNSERGKLFSLTTFYLLNHQLAFYYYTANGHANPPSGDPVWNWQWNPWVEYDVGQPVVNTLGLNDFEGNSGTDEYFVYDTQTNFEILGRQYQKSDGTRVLVLVKLMAPGQTEGTGSTLVTLPWECQRVATPGGGLASPSNTVPLVNNSGAILIEYIDQGGGGSGGTKKRPNG